jgi:hypothetical protein
MGCFRLVRAAFRRAARRFALARRFDLARRFALVRRRVEFFNARRGRGGKMNFRHGRFDQATAISRA